MIKVYNRKTKEYEIEKVAGEGLLKVLYGNGAGKAGLELLIKRKIFSWFTGIYCDAGVSSGKIKGFIDKFNIDMSLCTDSVEEYKSFNEFFVRKLKPEARPFPTDSKVLPSPGDGRLKAWENIHMDRLVQVKDITYTLGELIGDVSLAKKYHEGTCLILRLAPVDYHRFHFIDSGVCNQNMKIRGDYYSVNPIALESIPGVFCRNKREYSTLRSDHFGDILYMEVGATSVGSIIQTYKPGNNVIRGEEKGYFKFGGSTVMLFLEKGAAKIDEEILFQTENGYETRVLAGEGIGGI